MKYPLASSGYTFNAASKTITFSGTIPAEISNILHVANVTRGVIYFQPQAGAAYSGSYTSPVLTINADTSGHSNTDKLLVIYDDGSVGLTDAQLRASAVGVSAASLPLPSGASTSALQTTGNTSLSSIDGKLPALSSGRILVDGSGVTQPVSGTVTATGPLTDTQLRATAVPVSTASLPLPTGAATSANQSTTNTSLGNIDADLGAQADAAATTDTGTFSLIALVKRGLQNWTTLLGRIPSLVSGRIPVDGSGVTQPVSGTVTATGPLTDAQLRATAVPVSAASLPLPTGGATSALQTTGNTSLGSIDGKLPALSSGRILVDGSGVTQPVSGTVTATGPLTDTQLRAAAVPVSTASLPLPTGAATSALQTTGNTSLGNIDGKLPALQSGAIPISDNGGQLTVDGRAYHCLLDITRPANVTAYSAGDVIGTGSGDAAILTLSPVGPSGGFVIIQSIELVIGISAVPAGMTTFRLHLYSTKPQTAAADNSVFDLSSTDRGAYIGYIDLPTPIDMGTTCFSQVDYPGKLFKLASGSSSLFCELQTLTGFTPAANSETYSLRVKTLEAGL